MSLTTKLATQREKIESGSHFGKGKSGPFKKTPPTVISPTTSECLRIFLIKVSKKNQRIILRTKPIISREKHLRNAPKNNSTQKPSSDATSPLANDALE